MEAQHEGQSIEDQKKRSAVNYVFFAFLFVFLVVLHGLHVSLIEVPFTFSKYFYLMYTIGQSVLQVALFFSLFVWLQTFVPTAIIRAILAAAYFFVVCDVIDFFMERLLDISIWYALGFVLQESKGNFIEMLKASNISLGIWAVVFFGAALFVFVGLWLYYLMEKISKKRPIFFSRRLIVSLAVASILFLCLWDNIFSPFLEESPSRRYTKALPWKTTLFPPTKEHLHVEGFLKRPWMDKDCFAELDSHAFALQRKPDIFLFVAESLREDFITGEIAANISHFRDQSIHFAKAFSNANATHVSWFSLFYSLYPFHYASYGKQQWDKGSVPLSLLKKMGYEIHLYSGSRLKYYNMDEVLFGKERYLLSSERVYPQQREMEPWEADRLAMQDLCRDINKSERSGGRVFIVFLDSTHFGYSWPKDFQAPFKPYDQKINYIDAAVSSKNLDKIKNRYRNSIYYIDSLFGEFTETLKKSSLWDESIVVFTADHGEEFYENGHLFHASELSLQQTSVPLYLKIGSGKAYEKIGTRALCSHMDVFPTILHYLVGEDYFGKVLQGHSIFGNQTYPFAISARYNAGRSPYEFCIQREKQKILLQFENREDIFDSRSLNILGVKNHSEEDLSFSLSAIHEHFGEVLDNLFSP